MAYEVLARKWRPQQFDEVVGQSHVTQTLRNAIEAKRIAHAYLFVGPRGIGKTSIARILAKALNCAKGPTAAPCDQCDSCREIAAGRSMDVIEFDAASHTQVDKIRERVIETVGFATARDRYKIFIIDEVHMLSASSFNALLKTLEEPPGHVKFLFATTEPEKIPSTIISRCQRFDLRRIPVPMLLERLRQIAKSETVDVDEDALLAVARGAEGGLRDAESALDQLISFKGRKIAEDDVLSVFGLVSRSLLDELACSILKGDVKAVIRLVARMDEAGKDLQRVVVELLEHVRNLLVYLAVEGKTEGLDLAEAQIRGLAAQAGLTDTTRLLRIADVLVETADRMRYALSRRTLLETALIRCSRAAVTVSLEDILREVRELAGGPDSGPSEVKEQAAARPPALEARAREPAPAAVREPRPPAPAGPVAPQDECGLLVARWKQIVDDVAKVAPLARRDLLDARPAAVEGSTVTLAFDPEFASETEDFKSGRNRKALEHVLSGLLRREIHVKITLAESSGGEPASREAAPVAPTVAPAAPAPQAEGHGGHRQEPPAKGDRKNKMSRQNLIGHQAVQKALEVLDGSIIEVRE